jgi:hypothetical protein
VLESASLNLSPCTLGRPCPSKPVAHPINTCLGAVVTTGQRQSRCLRGRTKHYRIHCHRWLSVALPTAYRPASVEMRLARVASRSWCSAHVSG